MAQKIGNKRGRSLETIVTHAGRNPDEHRVGMADKHLRSGMDDDIGAQRERLVVERTREILARRIGTSRAPPVDAIAETIARTPPAPSDSTSSIRIA